MKRIISSLRLICLQTSRISVVHYLTCFVMPVTVKPSAHGSNIWIGDRYKRPASPVTLLSYTLADDSRETGPRKKLIQTSFQDLRKDDWIFATKNGFIHACLEAYNQHHSLVLRPDDVWSAILTQLSVYVNTHAGDLREMFVGHDGQKSLHIEVNLQGIDHGKMALLMTELLQASMKDEDLQDWIVPAFSTTTKIDEAVASIIFMGTMQKYFTYSWGTRCGLPAVTLLGDISDWVKIRQRAEKLSKFGPQSQRWLQLLRPVLDGFISTFREPESGTVKRFWQGICDEHLPNGSGSTAYSGWITAFCFWDENGKCLHGSRPGQDVRLTRGEIPTGFVKVPVTLYDENIQIPTEMIAGSMALKASSSQQGTVVQDDRVHGDRNGERARLDQIQPEVGWFMYKI